MRPTRVASSQVGNYKVRQIRKGPAPKGSLLNRTEFWQPRLGTHSHSAVLGCSQHREGQAPVTAALEHCTAFYTELGP